MKGVAAGKYYGRDLLPGIMLFGELPPGIMDVRPYRGRCVSSLLVKLLDTAPLGKPLGWASLPGVSFAEAQVRPLLGDGGRCPYQLC